MTPQRLKATVFAACACALALATLSELTTAMTLPLLVASFGPSCTVMFAYPDSKFCRPQNVMVAYMLSTFIALLVLHLGMDGPLALGLASGLSIFILLYFGLMHPPAIALPIIVFAIKPDWSFLIFPVFTGVTVLLLVARVGLHWFCKRFEIPREHQNTDTPVLGSLEHKAQ